MPLKQIPPELDLIERFEWFAERKPERAALKDNSGEISYAALRTLANSVAGKITKQSSDSAGPVIVVTGDDRMRCVGLLAAWKAGRAYVPIDPSLPEIQLANILQKLENGVLLTESTQKVARVAVNHRLKVVRLDDGFDTSVKFERIVPAEDALAWVIHTSGSSGRLKGVMQSYRNACHYVRTVVDGLRIGPEDRVAAASPLTVHAGVVYTLAVLSSGACLHLIAPTRETPQALIRRLVQEKVTVLFTVPTVFRRLVTEMAEHDGLPTLRLLRLSGETVMFRDVQLYWQRTSSQCVLSVGFGTTETGGVTHAYIDRTTVINGRDIPVGYPVEGVEVRIVDDQGQEVAEGLPGEIVVKGRYISPGYLNLPELTNSLFSVTEEGQRLYRTGDIGKKRRDGSFEHLGRKDLQVQLAGRRVELSAVESALSSLQKVREAAVVAQSDASDDLRLIAYVVAESDPPPTINELRHQLRELLPDYMIPSLFVRINQIPLTPNGKLDRQALPPLGNSRPALDVSFVAARTPTELKLVKIWSEVLEIDGIGVRDNFFDLGGHSLAAMRVVSRVINQFQVKIPLQSLFQSPTIADMASFITEHQGNT